MKARTTIQAATASEAREIAEAQFDRFFGHNDWCFAEEDALPQLVHTDDQRVVVWSVDFVAEVAA